MMVASPRCRPTAPTSRECFSPETNFPFHETTSILFLPFVRGGVGGVEFSKIVLRLKEDFATFLRS
jgi:hypothetical protein